MIRTHAVLRHNSSQSCWIQVFEYKSCSKENKSKKYDSPLRYCNIGNCNKVFKVDSLYQAHMTVHSCCSLDEKSSSARTEEYTQSEKVSPPKVKGTRIRRVSEEEDVDVLDIECSSGGLVCHIETCKEASSNRETLRKHYLKCHSVNGNAPHLYYCSSCEYASGDFDDIKNHSHVCGAMKQTKSTAIEPGDMTLRKPETLKRDVFKARKLVSIIAPNPAPVNKHMSTIHPVRERSKDVKIQKNSTGKVVKKDDEYTLLMVGDCIYKVNPKGELLNTSNSYKVKEKNTARKSVAENKNTARKSISNKNLYEVRIITFLHLFH